jgi:3-hydroxyisobutyrate dehydrogenase-like beta-hydroxyacid dehydrogenase
MSNNTVGILGLGIIGSRVAENVAKAGYSTAVWSRTTRERHDFKSSARAVAESSSVIQIFLRDDAALLAAVHDMLPALQPDQVIMNHATVSPEATQRTAELIHTTGASFLDAPFTGSKLAAQNAKLVYYIGGEPTVLAKVKPILEASGSGILHLGEIGQATILKIATNAVSAVTVKGLAEANALVKAAGVAPELLLEALQANANYSTLIGMKLPTMISGDYTAHFSLQNMLKDANYALGIAAKCQIPMPALEVMAKTMQDGTAAGKGDLDFSVVAED